MMELIDLFVLLVLPAFILLERLFGTRGQRPVRGWWLRAGLVSVAIYLLMGEVGTWWGLLVGDFHLFDGSALGTVGGAFTGVLIYELGHYWYHRAVHRYDWLWLRVGHQMHHSAERIDAFGAYFGHPLDLAVFTSIAVLVLYVLLGLTPEAAGLAGAFLAFNAAFQHADIRTPRWLGYLVQRPESHRIHHGRGIHRYNYSDLPLWDMVFGTFRNPGSEALPEGGFYDGASARVGEMLMGRDVSRPPARDAGLDDEGAATAEV